MTKMYMSKIKAVVVRGRPLAKWEDRVLEHMKERKEELRGLIMLERNVRTEINGNSSAIDIYLLGEFLGISVR